MSFGGVQGMITALKNNRIMKSDRKRMYDRRNDHVKGVYGPTHDHTQMKSHEFALFQKEQFLKRRQEKARNRRFYAWSALIVIGLIILFLIFWNNYDFNLLKSSEFQ